MTKPILRFAIGILCLSFLLFSDPPTIQRESKSRSVNACRERLCSEASFYESALDRAFPRPNLDGHREARLTTIRIEPSSFEPESELTIHELNDGRVQVIYYQLADKHKSEDENLHSHLGTLCLKNPKTTINDLLHAFVVNTKAIDALSELKTVATHPPVFEAPANVGQTVFIDGPLYAIWIRSATGDLHYVMLQQEQITNWISQTR